MTKKPYFTEEEFAELQKEIDAGYINVNKHPEFPLYIYNYSKSTQYEWRWNKYTIVCRGLILDENGCFVAKGFDKFFTDDQLIDAGMGDMIPTGEPFDIYDKVDGSFGVLYFWDDMPYIATRGSFVSEMANEANRWLRNQYGHIVFFPDYTYMFEIVYPENKIVVDYGSERKLVLLGVLDNNTMKEKDIYSSEFDYIEEQGLERVQKFDGITDWKQVLSKFEGTENKEGFVVHFRDSDFRVKMKFEWYKNLSYVMTYFTKRTVWKLIRDGSDMEKILSDIDDEYYPIVKGYVDALWDEYDDIYLKADALRIHHIELMNATYGEYGDKEFVHELKKYADSWEFGLVMALVKKKDVFNSIWRRIKPSGSDLVD